MERTPTKAIRAYLTRTSDLQFILWCCLASFGAYFCMYAFRKPFTTGLYAHRYLFGIDYKAVLIIVQVLGYMTSKFIGIKVIAEMQPKQRVGLGVSLISIAGLSLFLFAIIPFPYNFICLFFNGLPLGMIWGIVFSFLEGRKFTELLSFGLNVSIIMASGILKTVYLTVQQWLHASEFWMPFAMCVLFFPFFLFFVWMLSAIPKPNAEDIRLRTARVPMDRSSRNKTLMHYGWGVGCVVIMYALLTVLRDFRDNFSIEIWNEIDQHWSNAVFSQTEVITGFIVTIAIALIAFIKDNKRALWATFSLMIFGILLSAVTTLLFSMHLISPFYWMLGIGMGLFLAYTPVQTVLFERLIALFDLRANAGFFVYICDSVGYLGSVALLLLKSYFLPEMHWETVLINFSYTIVCLGLILITLSIIFFNAKLIKRL